MSAPTVSFDDVKVCRESDKAILVEIPDVQSEPVWVPKSAIHDDSEVYETGTEGTLIVEEWWAQRNGLL